MSRKMLVVGNWKMNGSIDLVYQMLASLSGQELTATDVVVCPPFPYFSLMKGSDVKFGAQDVSAQKEGAYTGEVSASQLAEAGCSFCIVGHSERREYHQESDLLVAKKAAQVLQSGMTPIVCFGESEQIRDQGKHLEHVEAQVRVVLDELGESEFQKVVLAYEPVWAIGTGKTASPEQAQEVHQHIRNMLAEVGGDSLVQVAILYGGSVKADNAESLFSQADVDGGLIGGASLKADQFAAICQAASNVGIV